MRVARVGAVVIPHEKSLGPGNEPLDFSQGNVLVGV